MPPFDQLAMVTYFGLISTIYALSYTMFVVPYTALGFELTEDYDERTRVISWRMYIDTYCWTLHPKSLRMVPTLISSAVTS